MQIDCLIFYQLNLLSLKINKGVSSGNSVTCPVNCVSIVISVQLCFDGGSVSFNQTMTVIVVDVNMLWTSRLSDVSVLLLKHTHTHICIYIYICVCVCMCV